MNITATTASGEASSSRTRASPITGISYFSFNLGAAAQTSDVVIVSKRMRRLALAHTVLAFLFNTTILALAVNVGAGLPLKHRTRRWICTFGIPSMLSH